MKLADGEPQTVLVSKFIHQRSYDVYTLSILQPSSSLPVEVFIRDRGFSSL